MEMQKKRRPMGDYMENVQRGITSNMRGTLVDWKYEEITPPKAVDFCQITDNTFDLEEVLKMEADILKSLNFEMGNPNVITFLKRFIGIASENQKNSNLQFEYLCNYLADLSLLDYECIRFLPSVVAASVIFLARVIIRPGVHPWVDLTRYSEKHGFVFYAFVNEEVSHDEIIVGTSKRTTGESSTANQNINLASEDVGVVPENVSANQNISSAFEDVVAGTDDQTIQQHEIDPDNAHTDECGDIRKKYLIF